MRPYRLLVLLGALVAAIGIPTVALAGGWSVVTLDSLPGRVIAGQETTVGFTVLQHGRTPVGGLTPTITLTPDGGGAPVTVLAASDGVIGHYVARFTLPRAGTWNWTIEAFYDGPKAMPSLTALDQPASGSTSSGARTLIDRAQVPLIAVAAVSTLAALGLAALRRRLLARHA